MIHIEFDTSSGQPLSLSGKTHLRFAARYIFHFLSRSFPFSLPSPLFLSLSHLFSDLTSSAYSLRALVPRFLLLTFCCQSWPNCLGPVNSSWSWSLVLQYPHPLLSFYSSSSVSSSLAPSLPSSSFFVAPTSVNCDLLRVLRCAMPQAMGPRHLPVIGRSTPSPSRT